MALRIIHDKRVQEEFVGGRYKVIITVEGPTGDMASAYLDKLVDKLRKESK